MLIIEFHRSLIHRSVVIVPLKDVAIGSRDETSFVSARRSLKKAFFYRQLGSSNLARD